MNLKVSPEGEGFTPIVETIKAATREKLDRIPAELKGRPQWVLWERNSGRKIPRTVAGHYASSTNPATWSTFDQVVAAGNKSYAGLGFVFTKDDPYVGIDLDNCRNPDTGVLEPWAGQIIERLNTYAEVSPSKTGAKLWAKGKLPGDGTGKKQPFQTGTVEIYQHGRYFAVTGESIGDKPIRDVGDVLPAIWAEVFGDAVTSASDDQLLPDPGCRLTGVEIAELAAHVLTLPEAIDGAGGSDATYHAACVIRRGGGVGDVGRRILDVYNAHRCDPRWTARELDHKWESARKHQPPAGSEFGMIEGYADKADPAPGAFRDAFRIQTSAQLDAGRFEFTPLIKGALIAKQNCIIAGPSKTYKTSLAADAGISLATGTPFLGHFDVPEPKRVIFMSGEIGEGGLQDYARRICNARDLKLAAIENLFWSTVLPKFGDASVIALLEAAILELAIEVLILDPLYLAMPGADAGNLMVIGGLLRSIGDVCQRHGVTPIFLHHTTKASSKASEPLAITDMAWAGFGEWARQWWLIKPIEQWRAGKTTLRLDIGGSTGVSSEVAVGIDEGTVDDLNPVRHWHVTVSPFDVASDAIEQRKADAAERKTVASNEAAHGRIRSALLDDGKRVTRSENQLRKAGGGSAQVKDRLAELIELGHVEATEPATTNAKVGYRLTDAFFASVRLGIRLGGLGGQADTLANPSALPAPLCNSGQADGLAGGAG